MNIIVRIYIFLLFLPFIMGGVKPVIAQDDLYQDDGAPISECDVIKEAIVKLRSPVFNTPTVWNAFYGQNGMEQISGVVPGDEESFIIAGNYTKDKDDQVYKPFLTKIDNRGRVIWEKRQAVRTYKTVNELSKTKNGYAVIGDIKSLQKTDGFYLGFYTKDGARIREIPVYEAGASLRALSFAPSKSGKSYIISAVKEAGGKKEAVLYKITLTGKKLWRRQYSPGLTTLFRHIHLADDGNYTMVGEIELEDKRLAGWAARIDDNGALLWQQPYPRGREATFTNAHTNADNSIIVSGQVKGIEKKENAGWVMKLTDDGEVIWQRYYHGKTHYNAPDMIVYDDGRVSVLLDGMKIRDRDRGHVRLLTLSPRGNVIDTTNFTDGQNAQGYALTLGHDNERVVVGHSQIVMPDDVRIGEKMKPMEPYVYDGWIFAATPLDAYTDVCAKEF